MSNRYVYVILLSWFVLSAGLLSTYGQTRQKKHNAEVGVALYSFHRFSWEDALDKGKDAGVEFVEGFSFHQLGGGFGTKTFSQLDRKELNVFKKTLKDRDLIMVSMYGDGKNLKEWEALFAQAKRMNLEFIVGEPAPELWDGLNELAGKYGLRLAIHQHAEGLSRFWHPDSVSAAIDGRENFAVCGDIGHWVRSGLDPVECLNILSDRLISIHVKDLDSAGNLDANDVRVGDGVIDYQQIIRELQRQGFAGYIFVECEHAWEDNLAPVSHAVKFLKTAFE